MATVETITREAMRPLIEPYGLAEAVRAGGMLFIAGQTGMDETHQIVDRRPEGAGGAGVPQYQGRDGGRRRRA